LTTPDPPRLKFESAEALDEWLVVHHLDVHGAWMQLGKKGNPAPSVTWAQAVPVLLRWGWIDGQRRRLDDDWHLVRITPRRARSVWSKINVEHAERLIAERRMQPTGLAQVDAAKADGRWDAAYERQSKMVPPPELQAALDVDPTAAASFAALKSAERYSICWKIHNAKRADTRQRHVQRALERLAERR
jgi:uncharacterized protein YdeI (YjbR/CyaY-like superfamily)